MLKHLSILFCLRKQYVIEWIIDGGQKKNKATVHLLTSHPDASVYASVEGNHITAGRTAH
jgi:hypothetical protein